MLISTRQQKLFPQQISDVVNDKEYQGFRLLPTCSYYQLF